MGYYVDLMNTNACIPKEKLEEAYEIMCELNAHNSMKGGGRWPTDKSDAEGPHEDVWFSWMPWNYPDVYSTAKEILHALGFEASEEQDGSLSIHGYSDKCGDEEKFILALGPVLSGSHGQCPFFEWTGEDGDRWKYEYDCGEWRAYVGYTEWKQV